MPYTKIMIHAVWGTKNRTPFLTPDIRRKIIHHIKENAASKGIYIDRINGHTEHLHCLFSLNADMSISKAMQLIKGESAFWLNKQNLIPAKFEWADEYFASSVSESVLNRVRAYIDRQEEHHRKVHFADEFQEFLRIHMASS
ncbi:IS200/IS605 family transposase [Flavihumibacter sp. R14]|nr:IS200/IS605 family transposase [Flavihumibacter soli]